MTIRKKPPHERDFVDNLDANSEPDADMEFDHPNCDLPQPESEPTYALVPDRVVALDKRKYTRAEAYVRFGELATLRPCIIIGYRETARHYCFEVIYERPSE